MVFVLETPLMLCVESMVGSGFAFGHGWTHRMNALNGDEVNRSKGPLPLALFSPEERPWNCG
jgi:hypothetical protein